MLYTDSKVHQFLCIADNIHAKQAPIKTTPKHVITQWVVLGVLTFLLAPLPLSLLGLGWVLFLAMAGGLLGMTLVNGKMLKQREGFNGDGYDEFGTCSILAIHWDTVIAIVLLLCHQECSNWNR